MKLQRKSKIPGKSEATREATNLHQIDAKVKELNTLIETAQAAADAAAAAIPSTATILAAVYPVGAIFHSYVATNPATLFGFGTWARIGEGRVLVGLKSTDADFDTIGETGGNKTIDLSHLHKVNPPNTTTGTPSGTNQPIGSSTNAASWKSHVHDVDIAEFDSGSGGSATQNIMNPYEIVYIWRRTA
jgi:hypothetical protein